MIDRGTSRARPDCGSACFRWFRLGLAVLLIGFFGTCIANAQGGSQGAAAASAPSSAPSGAPSTADQDNSTQSSATPGAVQSPTASPSQQTAAPAGKENETSAPAQNGNTPAASLHAAHPVPETSRNPTQQEAQQPVPYSDIPALEPLYVQVPTTEIVTQRFGSEAFAYGTGNANEVPADIPVGPDFVLGSGDNIVLNAWGSQSIRVTATIDRQGQITLPEAGPITINGMTIAQAQSAIQALLNTQIKREQVEISLGRVHTVRIYIVGDVQRPGAYDVSALSSPLGALYAAGGPTSRGSLRILRQYRGKDLVREIDLYDFLLKGVRSNTDRLVAGDTLLVPPAGPEVTIEGMVHHPAIYELNGEQTLSQVLGLAGGVTAAASLKQVKVQRIVAHQIRTMLRVDLSADPAQVEQQMSAFKVQGGDVVVIGQILPYAENAVFLEGHVYTPGMYPYREGMTIADLLTSYQDVLPEPSDRADLVRLVPPDEHPETIPFNLHDVLVGNVSIPLQPFDSIRIYGRYQDDAPRVSIQGEVLRPGDYPMSAGMTVTALVKMARGLKRSAYRDEADLSSYEIQNGQKVLVNHSEVALEKALEGDASADVVLRPGDVVSIRQLAGWQDIGATVTINGEVEHPGAYALTPGERLSDVLKRAGGFRTQAYPAAAVLEREQVRQLAEQAREQMIRRIENTPIQFRPGTMSQPAAAVTLESLQQQREQALAALHSAQVTGRLVINISSDISRWENTPADIELRPGDSLTVPKRPNFVVVSGQVFNPGAFGYLPGRDLNWYLRRTGGPTRLADKKDIYVLRADGSVTPRASNWDSGFLHMRMRPGDTVFVPEKVVGGSPVWQNVVGVAQVMSAAALPLAIAGTF